MFKVGQEFDKNGSTFCVLDMINLEDKKYILFSVENTELDYQFYEVINVDNGYNLKLVTEDNLRNKLFEIIEKEV